MTHDSRDTRSGGTPEEDINAALELLAGASNIGHKTGIGPFYSVIDNAVFDAARQRLFNALRKLEAK